MAACALVGAVLLFIVWREYPFVARSLAFENSAVTWLQTSVLVASATLCVVMRWYVFAAFLLIAALDERFMFHEAIAWHTSAAWIALLPMLVYGVAGAALLWRWWRDSPVARVWMLASAAAAAGAIGMDIAYRAVAPQVIEELFELAAETAALGGLLTSSRSSRS
jgi:hypothetical protein